MQFCTSLKCCLANEHSVWFRPELLNSFTYPEAVSVFCASTNVIYCKLKCYLYLKTMFQREKLPMEKNALDFHTDLKNSRHLVRMSSLSSRSPCGSFLIGIYRVVACHINKTNEKSSKQRTESAQFGVWAEPKLKC